MLSAVVCASNMADQVPQAPVIPVADVLIPADAPPAAAPPAVNAVPANADNLEVIICFILYFPIFLRLRPIFVRHVSPPFTLVRLASFTRRCLFISFRFPHYYLLFLHCPRSLFCLSGPKRLFRSPTHLSASSVYSFTFVCFAYPSCYILF